MSSDPGMEIGAGVGIRVEVVGVGVEVGVVDLELELESLSCRDFVETHWALTRRRNHTLDGERCNPGWQPFRKLTPRYERRPSA